MLLAGDIGGTKTTLALYASEGGLTAHAEKTYKSTEYPGLAAVAEAFVKETGAQVDRAVFGVAGPVEGGRASITNLPWVIREDALCEDLGVRDVKLLNDLEATAYGVLQLSSDDLYVLNEGHPEGGNRAVLAPGTGLGEAVLFEHEDHYHVMPSEGGHVDFAPTSLMELELLREMMGKFGHVSYERVCSGSGIPNIYAFLKHNGYAQESPETSKMLRDAGDPTPIIAQGALDGSCELCIATLSTFVSILGAEAGNLVLKVMATGGLYLGGGIPPRIVSKLKDGTFMAAFVNKGRFARLLADVPVYVILNPKTGLLGAAAYGLGLK